MDSNVFVVFLLAFIALKMIVIGFRWFLGPNVALVQVAGLRFNQRRYELYEALGPPRVVGG